MHAKLIFGRFVDDVFIWTDITQKQLFPPLLLQYIHAFSPSGDTVNQKLASFGNAISYFTTKAISSSIHLGTYIFHNIIPPTLPYYLSI